MDYKRAYEITRKKCETLEKQYKFEEERAEAWYQITQANNAIMAAMVQQMGGEVVISQDSITDALKKGVALVSTYDDAKREHTVRVAEE